jgi:hypothetical protein
MRNMPNGYDDYPPGPPPHGPPPEVPRGPPPRGPPPTHAGPYRPSKSYIGLIIIGIFILLIGGIIVASSGFLNDPYREDYVKDLNIYDDEYDDAVKDYEKDVEAYNDNTRNVNAIGSVIQYVGLILLGLGMVLGALRDTELSPNVRLGMLIALAIIIGFKIGGALLYLN